MTLPTLQRCSCGASDPITAGDRPSGPRGTSGWTILTPKNRLTLLSERAVGPHTNRGPMLKIPRRPGRRPEFLPRRRATPPGPLPGTHHSPRPEMTLPSPPTAREDVAAIATAPLGRLPRRHDTIKFPSRGADLLAHAAPEVLPTRALHLRPHLRAGGTSTHTSTHAMPLRTPSHIYRDVGIT